MSSQSELLTTKLNNGATVLAKARDGRLWAKTFANLTQARKAQAAAGPDWAVCCWGRPFYVARVDAEGKVV